MAIKCSVNYTTFSRDLEFLDCSLRSFIKYSNGFSSVTIVVPTTDMDKFLHFEKKFSRPDCPVWIKTFLEYPGKGFVHHMAMKCCADVFSPDATHILHMDPDCLFVRPVTPDDYFVDGKAVLLIEPFDVLRGKHPGRYGWRERVEKALRFEPTHETMCRHPEVHPEWVYKALRTYMEAQHQTPFVDFVLRQENKHPQGFAEFPTLGAFGMKFFPKDYHLIDRGERGEAADPEAKLEQFWSYQGVGKNRDKINQILA